MELEPLPVTVVLPADLAVMVRKDAELNLRSEANQVVWVLLEYYRDKQKSAELFNPIQLREGKRGGVPVFRSGEPLPPQPSSLFQKMRDRDDIE